MAENTEQVSGVELEGVHLPCDTHKGSGGGLAQCAQQLRLAPQYTVERQRDRINAHHAHTVVQPPRHPGI